MAYYLRTMVQRAKFAREAGAVRRLHVHRIIGEYDVAQHSFNALCLMRILNPGAGANLLWAVLCHDMPERLTGDIPSPAKNNSIWFDKSMYARHEQDILLGVGFSWKPLSAEEEKWLKVVDSLEFLLFCKDQILLGNNSIKSPLQKIEEYIKAELHSWPEPAVKFYKNLHKEPWVTCDEL